MNTKKVVKDKKYFQNLDAWNGEVDYISEIAEYLIVKEKDELKFITKLKTALVEAVTNVFNHEKIKELLFLNGRQGIGKTHFIWWLFDGFDYTDTYEGIKPYIQIESIDWDYPAKLNLDKIWSQAYSLYKNEKSFFMSTNEV